MQCDCQLNVPYTVGFPDWDILSIIISCRLQGREAQTTRRNRGVSKSQEQDILARDDLRHPTVHLEYPRSSHRMP